MVSHTSRCVVSDLYPFVIVSEKGPHILPDKLRGVLQVGPYKRKGLMV